MLEGKKVAILATDGFEQSELETPRRVLRDAGAQADVISLRKGDIRGETQGEWADKIAVDHQLSDVAAGDYDALVLPGGVRNPDILRAHSEAVDFVKAFYTAKKPIGAICHGPWLLVEADALRGRRATSYGSLKTDLKNAGADWVDAEVVVDQGIVTSRSPDDLTAFCSKLVEEIGEGPHRGRQPSREAAG